MIPRVLIVAGSDSGGGAGIQADLKTVMALGGYAQTAITALTAQDTLGVHGVFSVPPAFVALQIATALGDIGADAVKTGMLGDAAMIDAVADALAGCGVPIVVDPVMVAKGGHALLAPDAVETLRRRLLPMAAVLTPNIPEAEALTGRPIATVDNMRRAAEALLGMGPAAVLLKGGHLDGDVLTDVLVTADEMTRIVGIRIPTRHTHGTGCTLATAIATGLSAGLSLVDAVIRAHTYVLAAIQAAPGFGAGHGPLDHAFSTHVSRPNHAIEKP